MTNVITFPSRELEDEQPLKENYAVCDIFIGAAIAQTLAHDYQAASILREIANTASKQGLIRVLVPGYAREAADKYANLLSETGQSYRIEYMKNAFGGQ